MPYYNYDVHRYESQYTSGTLHSGFAALLVGRKTYEIAWRTHSGIESRWVNMRIEDFDIGWVQATDRYGSVRIGCEAEHFAVDEARTSTNVRFGAKAEDGSTAWVMFKNISLVPGQDMGFEIIQGDEAEPEHP